LDCFACRNTRISAQHPMRGVSRDPCHLDLGKHGWLTPNLNL